MKNIFLKSKFTSAVFLIIMRITKRFQRHHLSEYSAYSVMFIILSFVPFFIILLSFLKALPVFTETDGYRITGADELTEYLKNLLSEIDVKAGGALLSLTSLLSLWSASRGLIGIINGLNRIQNISESRGFFRIRLYSVVYTLLLMAVIIVVLVILIFGVAPLVFGVFCFIKLKNAKQPYRILYIIGVSLSALAVILLITLAVIVLPLI